MNPLRQQQTARKLTPHAKAGPTSPPLSPDTPENRRDRFLRIGTARMQRVLDNIRLLGNLSNANYEWREDDLRSMQDAIVNELGKTIARFQKGTIEKPKFIFTKDE